MNASDYWHTIVHYLCVEFIIGVGVIINSDFQEAESLCVNGDYRRGLHIKPH